MVYLHTPRVFHNLMDLSRDADTICRLSAEKATLSTSLVCPTKRRVVTPRCKSHRRRVWSQEPDRANWPSEEITTSETKWLWPVKRRLGTPKLPSSRLRFQTMMLLSREEDRIMSGTCWVVAIWVTQSLWPRRTPTFVSCSVLAIVFPGRPIKGRNADDGRHKAYSGEEKGWHRAHAQF